MGDDVITIQNARITAAETAKVLCIAVDSTSREYDLSLVALGTTFGKGHDFAEFFINLSADGNDVYYTMSDASGKTVDDTAKLAAGNPVAGFTANGCDVVYKGSIEPVVINRSYHRYLQIKCAAGNTATLRIRLSSDLRPGDHT